MNTFIWATIGIGEVRRHPTREGAIDPIPSVVSTFAVPLSPDVFKYNGGDPKALKAMIDVELDRVLPDMVEKFKEAEQKNLLGQACFLVAHPSDWRDRGNET
jgi:hypothetical protein